MTSLHSLDEKKYVEDLKKYSQLRRLLHLAQKMVTSALDIRHNSVSQDPLEIATAVQEQIRLIEKHNDIKSISGGVPCP